MPLRNASDGSSIPEGRLEHLLVVAGPYGSGKTTFSNQLRTGTLAEEIRALLPPDARGWMQTSLRKVFEPSATDSPAGRGMILHYNVLRPHVRGFPSYAADPVLAAMKRADAITVVTLHAPLPTLIDQFVARSLVEQAEAPIFTRLRRLVRDRLASMTGRRKVGPNAPAGAERLGGRYRRVYLLYREPGWLEGTYRDWETFLRAQASHARLAIVHVEPAVQSASGPAFQLLE